MAVPERDAVNRHISLTDPVSGTLGRSRIVGVVADVDDENVVRETGTDRVCRRSADRLCRPAVRARVGDPYALVPAVTRVIRQISRTSPLTRRHLEDVRAQVLSPERLNASCCRGLPHRAAHRRRRRGRRAGVLSERADREFGVRLAVGASPRRCSPASFPRAQPSRRSASSPAPWRVRAGRGGARVCRERTHTRRAGPFSVRRLCSSALRLWRR